MLTFFNSSSLVAVTEEGKNDPSSLKATYFFRREYILNNLIGMSCLVTVTSLT